MQVEWKKKATAQLEKAVVLSLTTFGEKTATKFYQQVKDNDIRLTANPRLGSLEPLLAHRKMTYRSLVVHEHYKLIYRIDEKKEVLYVCALLDVRREPDKMKHQV